MQNYIIAALCAALLVVGLLYRNASGNLDQARTDLAALHQVDQANQKTIKRLEDSLAVTDRIMGEWNEDRITLAGVRNAARQAIREAIRDETFKTWFVAPAHDDAWRLLNKAFDADADGNSAAGPSNGSAGGLPGNADSGVGKQR